MANVHVTWTMFMKSQKKIIVHGQSMPMANCPRNRQDTLFLFGRINRKVFLQYFQYKHRHVRFQLGVSAHSEEPNKPFNNR